jgi:phosphatidylglycerol---prolipoprotein diacylglyceryl transferase
MFPIILQTKYFTIHSLWFFITIALIVGTYTFIKLGLKNGLKLQFLTENSLILLLTSLLGARIFAILFNWKMFFYEYSFETFFQIFKIWDKGLSLWGALIVAIPVLYYLCKKNDQDFWKWMDSLVPAFLVGLAIACIGLFMDGKWYGNETRLPWGVNFESPSIKYTVPIHPTQIYIMLYTAVIAALSIFSIDHPFFKKSGKSAILAISAFSFLHFLQGFTRGDDVTMIYIMRLPQIIAFIAFAFTLIFYFVHYNKADSKKTKK